MVVSLSNKNRPHIPPPLQGLTRVEEMTVLGVTFTHTLSFAPHIFKVSVSGGKAAASLYALRTLNKAHAYTARPYATSRRQCLLLVAHCSTQVHRWSEFINADEKAKLQSVLNKAVRYGFLKNYKPVEYLFESSDTT